ncbi:hypothetical protein [Streptomyces sp. NRRL WC-3742]|uniref:hypothetical protein n=1 Tax=Streptomyces sp. NRRL WC-3742 TaxID=1463934 RepID=UPI0007C4F7FB|nr:hypothetical protein [Streptomyces sp. NRRL WC-3742]
MAASGYGKRSAPDQFPRGATDFSHLPAREAYLASLIDRLPDGAAMDVKTLAAYQPLFGQMAVRTALNRLSAAGHLRRIRERIDSKDCRWVHRTYFSRTPRSDAWWDRFIATGEASTPADPDPPKERPATPAQAPAQTPAYAALADLGLADARLSLSAADCTALEPLAAEWFARGTTPALFTAALASGLPPEIHSPAAFTRRRLVDKLPPERPVSAVRITECTACRAPCRQPALLGGLCRPCRSTPTPPPPTGLSPAAVHHHAARIRQAMATGTRAGRGPGPLTTARPRTPGVGGAGPSCAREPGRESGQEDQDGKIGAETTFSSALS